MRRVVEILKQHGELKIIDEELDIELEIPHIAYLEIKKQDSKALLFNNPVYKNKNGEIQKFDIPVLMNVFGSFGRLELLLGKSENIAREIENLLKLSSPKSFLDSIKMLKNLSILRHIREKKTQSLREKIFLKDEVSLFDLPILKTWEKDGGRFITMGQVYTKNLDGNIKNLGMYRLQVYDKNHLGLHWQIHKDSTHFFEEYRSANKKMPISIGIGGEAMYSWCAQAPLPFGMYELMLFGLIKKSRPKVAKCVTNDICVPFDCDIVIEGFVDTNILKDEGPFGDHTGFYTPIEPYPVLEVSAITLKKDPIYLATVVGKPPVEDKYLGYMIERVFLPMIKTMTPSLVDFYMPENGVFHNLILTKIDPQYPAHAEQIMHAFWGVGQMSFVKHAIFVPKSAPDLTDADKITEFILNHLDINSLLFSHGICDALDHSSPNFARGGKLGVDCTKEVKKQEIEILSDEELFKKIKANYPEITNLRQIFINTFNPITLVLVDKKTRVLDHIDAFLKYCKIVCVLDSKDNDLENLYMILWRATNNIDARRDICVKNGVALIDASAKGALESHFRAWPDDVYCNKKVLENLVNRGVLEKDEALWDKFQILEKE